MSFISIDIILYITFLAVNLILGLQAGRHVKNLKEFSVGNKDFSTATIVSTIVATWIGGGFMFYGIENIYTKGILFFIPLLGAALCLLLTGQVLAIRMGEFLNNLSVAESMGKLYGPTVRTITALSGILMAIGSVAMQFKVIGNMITLLFGFEGPWVAVLSAGIVIFYSAFGGIRSVIITDVLQFFVFSLFIPILALVAWNHLKNPSQVAHTLTTHSIFSLRDNIGWNLNFLSALGVMLYFVIPGMNPPIFQRIVMSKNLEQAKKSFTYAAGITLLMVISVAWIAILLKSDNDKLNAKDLVNYIITAYAYPGLKGLIAIGITAMAMSTADSYLNSSAVLAVHDIIKPLKASWSNWKGALMFVRIFSLVFGSFALVLALRATNLLDLLLLTSSFYMPIFTVPLLLAIFGFRSTPRSVLIGMVAGFTTVMLWDHFLAHTGIKNLIPGMLANMLFLMGSHYILRQEGGWVGIKVPGPLMAARQARREAWQRFIHNLKHTNIYDSLKQNLPVHEAVYSLFAIYVLGATYSLFYTIAEDIISTHYSLYKLIYHSVLVCTAAFLTYPAWPPTFKSKRFITFAWPAGIFYILFVVGSILVLMSGFHEVQVMIFMLNLIMAALFLSWPLMLLVSSLGIVIGCFVFYMYLGDLYACTNSLRSIQFNFIYVVLLVSSFLITILFRFKEKQRRLENKNTYLVTLYEEKSNELAEILKYREEVLKELSADDKTLLDQTTAAYIQQILYRMGDYMRLEVTQINLDQLLLKVKEKIKLTDLTSVPQLITHVNTKQESINGDIAKIKQLLVNGILYVHQHNLNNEPIHIVIADAKLGHKVDYIKDYTRQLVALKFTITTEKVAAKQKDIYMLEQVPLMSQHAKKGEIIENARIIHAHYGYAELDEAHAQVYVLPVNVREVRGKVMELLREPAVADPTEINHPLAIQLEKELLAQAKRFKLDLNTISKGLDTIKRYHAGVKRKSGEPFFTHPIQVALILLGYDQDQDAVIAALLHDTVEDTSLSLVQIKAMFGEQVAFIVNKVTNLEDNLRRVSSQDHENVYRIMNYEDERVAFVKLADRLHNMRTISGHSSLAKQKHIANETLNFFVPLAHKLQLTSVAEELEKLSLNVLAKE